jgi:hypothetical protein
MGSGNGKGVVFNVLTRTTLGPPLLVCEYAIAVVAVIKIFV